MSLNWTNELVFKLIDLYEQRRALWDSTAEEYRDRKKKHDAWEETAQALNTDKLSVERKMKILTTQFCRELKKAKPGENVCDVSKWFALKRMMFLQTKYMPQPETFARSEGKSEEEDEESHDDDSFSVSSRSDTRIKKEIQTPEHNNTIRVEELYPIKEVAYKRPGGRDEYDVYGEYIAMKLRKITSNYARATTQNHIDNILYNAEIGEYDFK